MTVLENPATRWLIQQTLNGNLFYLSIALLAIAGTIRIAGAWRPTYHWRRRTTALCALGVFGLILSLGSMTPWWAVFLGVLGMAASRSRHQRRSRAVLGGLAAVMGLVAVVDACWYELGRGRIGEAHTGVYVIGDSLSAPEEIDTGEEASEKDPSEKSPPWPTHLQHRIGWPVANLAVPAANLATALNILDRHEVKDSTVILMIGGNDILGSTAPGRFAARMDALLGRLAEGGNDLVLVEIPAPPTAPWFGWIQRRLAAEHDAHLVPKRVVADVLFGTAESTTDGLHLSRSGHGRMAARLEAYMRRWFSPPPDYELPDLESASPMRRSAP